MNPHDAEQLATDLMAEFGLDDWLFEFDTAKRRFGYCSYRRRTITLSIHLTNLNTESEVERCIRHEIAHALGWDRYRAHGHGRVWQEMCAEVGIPGEPRCYGDDVETPPPTFKGTCPNCGQEFERLRRRRVACTRCCDRYNEGRFDERFLIRWRRIRRQAA